MTNSIFWRTLSLGQLKLRCSDTQRYFSFKTEHLIPWNTTFLNNSGVPSEKCGTRSCSNTEDDANFKVSFPVNAIICILQLPIALELIAEKDDETW